MALLVAAKPDDDGVVIAIVIVIVIVVIVVIIIAGDMFVALFYRITTAKITFCIGWALGVLRNCYQLPGR